MAETKKTTKKTTKKKSLVETVIDEVEDMGKKTLDTIEDAVEKVEETLGLDEDSDSKSTKKKTTKKTTKKSALEKLKEKAKALEESVKDSGSSSAEKLKEQLKSSEETPEKPDGLVPIEDYLKSSIHLGTRVITPDMRPFVYKRRADGLAVFNTAMLDDMIIEAAKFLSEYDTKDITLVCKREAGWKAARLFSEITGIKVFTKKYPAGILTNPNLDDFLETELIFIVDPWLDKNALTDANNVGIPVLSICDTNNYTSGINKIIPGNNKSNKSIGMILYLMATLYVKNRKLDIKVPEISDWIDDWDSLTPPK